MVRHYPPAYHRYRERHPALSIRLTKDLKEAIDKVRGDLSYGRFIRKLMDEKADAVKAEARGYEKGYREAMKIERFTAPCSICGEPMVFTSKDSNWDSKVKPIIQKAFSNWRHIRCKERS